MAERSVPPGVAVRPLTDPVPLFPWAMVFRREVRHPGLDALRASADALAEHEDWLRTPPKSWLPEPDAAMFGSLPQPNA